MNKPAAQVKPISTAEASFRLAMIVEEKKDAYLLDEQGFQFNATSAFSCLVKPLAGDVVLYASTGNGQNIIVSIVSRKGDQSMAIEFPQHASMTSKQGSIRFDASQSISLSSSSLNLFSRKLVQKTNHAYLEVQKMNAHGEELNASFNKLSVISSFVTHMAKQVINKFGTYIRHSEQLDQVKAVNMSRSVDELFTLNSNHTIMQSNKDTKIDGERIHIG